jgi:putative spermidine/putrescine transport system permease protein
MTAVERVASGCVWFIAFLAVIFLMAPLVITIAVAFGDSTVFTLPPPGWTLRWFERLPTTRGLAASLGTSVQIAALSTMISLVLGTLCAIALVRGTFRGREVIATFLVSPLMLPGLVIGIAMLQGFRVMGLRETWTSLLVAHVVITLPYVVRTVYAALGLFDFTLVEAARTLGCAYPAALRKVMVPALAPAFFTSGMFALLASMDNYPVSIFFTDAWTKTLPIQMLQLVEERPDPMIAAISACLIALATLSMIVGDRLVGLRKLAEF